MRLWRKRGEQPHREPQGDPEGVARAEEELRKSEAALAHDKRHVIEPLKREAYQNNIQALVEELLRPKGLRGHNEPGAVPC